MVSSLSSLLTRLPSMPPSFFHSVMSSPLVLLASLLFSSSAVALLSLQSFPQASASSSDDDDDSSSPLLWCGCWFLVSSSSLCSCSWRSSVPPLLALPSSSLVSSLLSSTRPFSPASRSCATSRDSSRTGSSDAAPPSGGFCSTAAGASVSVAARSSSPACSPFAEGAASGEESLRRCSSWAPASDKPVGDAEPESFFPVFLAGTALSEVESTRGW